MRILTGRISANKDGVVLHIEVIKPLVPKGDNQRFSFSHAEMFARHARVRQRKAIIHAKMDAEDKIPEKFLLTSMDISLAEKPEKALALITEVDLRFKARQADIILLDDSASFALHIPELTAIKSDLHPEKITAEFNLPITLGEYIRGKCKLNNPYFAQGLVSRILNHPENKDYHYLAVFSLLNPELNNQSVILHNLALFFQRPENTGSLKNFMKLFNDMARKTCIAPALGQIAEDGGTYNSRYTELRVFEQAQFVLLQDGRVQIIAKNSPSWEIYYTEGCQSWGKLKDEWLFLGKVLGIEFSEDTQWDDRIILTRDSSRRIINQGLLYNDEFIRKLAGFQNIMTFRRGFFQDKTSTLTALNRDVVDRITHYFNQPGN